MAKMVYAHEIIAKHGEIDHCTIITKRHLDDIMNLHVAYESDSGRRKPNRSIDRLVREDFV